MLIKTQLEEWSGSAVFRARRSDYARKPASTFSDKPSRLTERQAVFYRNLIRIAVEIASDEIPVDFEHSEFGPMYLDRGCVKIAEHSGFIEPLADGPSGVVDAITLAWDVI